MEYARIQDWFSAIAQQHPKKVAISRANDWISYQELEQQSNHLANVLIRRGAGEGTIVVIFADDSIKVVIAILATLKAGAVFVPLTPETPLGRLQAISESIEPQFWLTQASLLPHLQQLPRTVTQGKHLMILDSGPTVSINTEPFQVLQEEQQESDISAPQRQVDLDAICYIYFTSGSTGKPKGIAGRLKAIAHFIDWEINALKLQRIRSSQLVIPSFDAFLRDIFVPLCCGGTLCVPSGKETLLDTRQLVHWLDEQKVELIHCVPSVFRALLNAGLTSENFPGLRYILMAGEPLLPADVKQWMTIFGDRVQLVNLYGASETTMTKFYYFVSPEDGERSSIPVGQPIPGASLLLVDGQNQPCPIGSEGEIFVKTDYRTLGYYQQPELTDAVFVPNPLTQEPEDIVYKTGDLGKLLDDGNLLFLGRKDFQVKIRGVRIELGEIENLLRSHPQINDVVVVDRDDPRGNKYLCAYTVAKQPLEPGQLREFLLQQLPDYMIPSSFVQLQALPRNINGKVDRKSLPDPRDIQRDRVLPRTAKEAQIAEVWQQVLGCGEVGVTDNFFELGGHSLLAVQLCRALEDSLKQEVPLAALLRSPTIAGLITLLEQDTTTLAGSSIISIQSEGEHPPIFGIHVLGRGMKYYRPLVKQLGPHQPIYGLSFNPKDEKADEANDVKELSRLYIRDLQTLQPQGPYYLLGVSFGGRVAFEMAQQLQAQGQEVALLGLIDTTARTGVKHLPATSRVSGHWQKLQEEGVHYITRKLKARLGRIRYRNKARLAKIYQRFGQPMPETLQTVASREKNIQLKKQHFPQPYHGKVTLFRAKDRKAEVGTEIDPDYGWRDLAVGGLDIYDIPGDHLLMLQEPNVQVLAAKIKEIIEPAPEMSSGDSPM
ncbi:amino acid adenylation domain-containing protein [Sodalinema gerasimenkoae]|uniref:amino acid adenylation domain-containing protein n=1 Tax=Sodalinema gerasimenkoae TaxID=2862348 RepID=UPI001356D875|nr:amino acid adenylation domain-containing protein [Sodalinema gerasimenkoae]